MKQSTTGAVTGLIFVILCSGRIAAGGITRGEVPFELEDGHLILVKGSLGDLNNRHFVVDTGTSVSVISRPLARKLKLKGRIRKVEALGKLIETEEVVLPSLTLGSVHFEDVPVQVGELSSRSSEGGFYSFLGINRALQVDALIGLEVLKRSSLSIDYETRTIRFGPVVHSASSCRLYPQVPFLFILARVAGRRVYLLLDTGAGELILFRTRLQDRLTWSRTGGVRRARYFGGMVTLRKVRLSEVSLGTMRWEEWPAYLLDGPDPELGLDGVVGPSSLGLRRLNLDFEHQRISWD